MPRGHPADGPVLVQQDADKDALVPLPVARHGVRSRFRGHRGGELPGLVAPNVDLRQADVRQHLGNVAPGTGRKAGIGTDPRCFQPFGSPRPDSLDPRQVVGAGHIIALAQVSRHGDLLVRAGRCGCVPAEQTP